MNDFDPIGEAVYNYHFNQDSTPVFVHSEDFDDDEMHSAYFFRTFQEMPPLEQLALKQAAGRVLDVGACAGCHSIYLKEKGCEVVALERSKRCVEVLKDRGLQYVVQADFFQYEAEAFDTILLLMNGTGIAGTIANLSNFFRKLKELLKPEGKIYIDSSDLIFLYENEDGSADINIAGSYYGELIYQTSYKGKYSKSFPWLYLDFDLLKSYAELAGLQVESVKRGEHYDYLATITHQ
ncbi:MAG: class I SAM-dependent methyltransferase [Mangrovibacterium sp.]